MNTIPENLRPVIARVAGWQNERREIRVTPLGGLTNTNFRVSVDGEAFVLRVSGPNTARLGIQREHEWAALQNAAAAGIGPEVIAYLPPEGHLVTRWIDGRHWTAEEFRTHPRVRLLTETVRRIHALPSNGAVFSPFQRVNAFLETARSFHVHLPDSLESAFETMQIVQAEQQADPSAWQCFCHNDLASVNYLFNEPEHKITVLDWEFSGWGDRYYDLATIVYTHDSDGPISPELENWMLECYFGASTPFQRRRLAGMKFMLLLFTGAWALAQTGMQQAGLIPVVEDFDYLDFAGYLFAHDIRVQEASYRSGLRNQESTL